MLRGFGRAWLLPHTMDPRRCWFLWICLGHPRISTISHVKLARSLVNWHPFPEAIEAGWPGFGHQMVDLDHLPFWLLKNGIPIY